MLYIKLSQSFSTILTSKILAPFMPSGSFCRSTTSSSSPSPPLLVLSSTTKTYVHPRVWLLVIRPARRKPRFQNLPASLALSLRQILEPEPGRIHYSLTAGSRNAIAGEPAIRPCPAIVGVNPNNLNPECP